MAFLPTGPHLATPPCRAAHSPQSFLAGLNEARTSHLEEEDKQKVAGECQTALAWLGEKEGLQQQVAKVRSNCDQNIRGWAFGAVAGLGVGFREICRDGLLGPGFRGLPADCASSQALEGHAVEQCALCAKRTSCSPLSPGSGSR